MVLNTAKRVVNVHTLLTDISVDIFSGKGEAYYAEHFTISRYSFRHFNIY